MVRTKKRWVSVELVHLKSIDNIYKSPQMFQNINETDIYEAIQKVTIALYGDVGLAYYKNSVSIDSWNFVTLNFIICTELAFYDFLIPALILVNSIADIDVYCRICYISSTLRVLRKKQLKELLKINDEITKKLC